MVGANALRWDPCQDPSSPTFSGETEICIALGLGGFVETNEEVERTEDWRKL